MNKIADRLETIGVVLVLLGVVCALALIPATLEVGGWTEVLTWFALGDAAVLILGAVLFEIGYRKGEAMVTETPRFRARVRKSRTTTPMVRAWWWSVSDSHRGTAVVRAGYQTTQQDALREACAYLRRADQDPFA